MSNFSTRALLLCRFDLESEQVQAVIDALFANRKNLAGLHPKLAELDPAALETQMKGLKPHPGVADARVDLEVDTAPAWGN